MAERESAELIYLVSEIMMLLEQSIELSHTSYHVS